jgi:hypothetical protein
MIRLFTYCVVLFWSAWAFSQTLNTQLSKPDIQLGERVRITFSVQSESPIDSIRYNAKKDIFPAKSSANGTTQSVSVPYELEIMSLFRDTSYQEGELFIWKGIYEVTGWDSAYVVLPPEQIIIDDSLFYFPAALIEVSTPNADPVQPIKDINEEFTEIPSEEGLMVFLKENALWLSLMVALLAVIIFLLIRSKKDKKPAVQLSLREEILQEISTLEKSKLYEKNLKEYYFELSMIVRRFFSAHFEERMLDKTSGEIELLLAKKGLEESTIDVINKILNQSDLVKFAKSEPPIADVYKITNDAKRVVNEVASLELSNE